MTKNLGSTIAIIFGFLWFSAGLSNAVNKDGLTEGLIAGPMVLFGVLAYRSAKKKTSLIHATSNLKKMLFQIICLSIVSFLWLGRADLKRDIATMPLSTVVTPIWIFVAYIVAKIRYRSPDARSNAVPLQSVATDNRLYSELIQLDDLRQRGILTDAEFEEQKRKTLARDR